MRQTRFRPPIPGVRYVICWRNVAETFALSASLVGLASYLLWGP
jgi:hypothetical protein